jgi:PAS domain S-box-containing protein
VSGENQSDVSQRLSWIDVALVDRLVVPASLHDVDGRFLHMNAAAERACGRSSAEMRGLKLTTMLPRETHDHVLSVFRRAMESGEPTDFETVFVDVSGELRGVRAQHLPLRDGEAIVGALVLAFDVVRPPALPRASDGNRS